MNTSTFAAPVTLAGSHVTLVPLDPGHETDLADAACDGRLWEQWTTHVPRPEAMGAEIRRRLDLRAAGSMCPFAVLDPSTGRAVGMTSYMHIEAAHRRVEIGSTWYRQSVQRTALNTEAKRLLLGHAFERLDCIAVEFRTHVFNHRSRRAIERLGARLDGILRNHQIQTHPNAPGVLRDTCVYSVIAGEWPAVKVHLDHLLGRPPS